MSPQFRVSFLHSQNSKKLLTIKTKFAISNKSNVFRVAACIQEPLRQRCGHGLEFGIIIYEI